MNEMHNDNVLLTTHLVDDNQLENSLLSIHFQFATFYIEPTTFISPDQVQFFAELYPAFDVAVSHITKLQRREDFNLTQKMAVNLYFSYMFALINAIPAELMRIRFTSAWTFLKATCIPIMLFNH